MKNSKLILLLLISIYKLNLAQLSIDAFTDKEIYEYGEQIELYCKITNNSDSTFEFFAPTYKTCQAEFSFNNFNSWEHTACLATNELLTFKPHNSKIYKWVIDPIKTGLPNNDGTQQIICKYYFDLTDTIFIQTPQILEGELQVEYHKSNTDSIASIRNKYNIEVLFGDGFGEIKSEIWKIEGINPHTLIEQIKDDSLFLSINIPIFIEYDNISDENPFDYYPLHVGDKWIYEIAYDPVWEIGGEYIYFLKKEVINDTTLDNGKKYFTIKETSSDSNKVKIYFERIDSLNDIVYRIDEEINNSEFIIVDLNSEIGDTSQILTNIHNYYEVENIKFVEEKFQNIFKYNSSSQELTKNYIISTNNNLKFFEYSFAKNFGKTFQHKGSFDAYDEYQNLIAAFINNTKFGDTTLVGIESNQSQIIPTNFSLSQNYPNPFNPTTTIEYSVPNVEMQNFASLQLVVYDVLGREVATLVNQTQKPGNYKIQFDGLNLPSGVYYYQLKSGNFSQTKKMLILK